MSSVAMEEYRVMLVGALTPYRDHKSLERLTVNQLASIAADLYKESYFELMAACNTGCNGKDSESMDTLERVADVVGVDVKLIQNELKVGIARRELDSVYRGRVCKETQAQLSKMVPKNWWREWFKYQAGRWTGYFFANNKTVVKGVGIAATSAVALAAFSAIAPVLVTVVSGVAALGTAVVALPAAIVLAGVAAAAGAAHGYSIITGHVHRLRHPQTSLRT